VSTRKPPPGWTLLKPGRSGKGGTWQHESGWIVAHCGGFSPTCPYALIDPAHPGDVTMSHNGLGFASMQAARQVVEDIAAGRRTPTDDCCTPGTRRVPCVTADGTNVPIRLGLPGRGAR